MKYTFLWLILLDNQLTNFFQNISLFYTYQQDYQNPRRCGDKLRPYQVVRRGDMAAWEHKRHWYDRGWWRNSVVLQGRIAGCFRYGERFVVLRVREGDDPDTWGTPHYRHAVAAGTVPFSVETGFQQFYYCSTSADYTLIRLKI